MTNETNGQGVQRVRGLSEFRSVPNVAKLGESTYILTQVQCELNIILELNYSEFKQGLKLQEGFRDMLCSKSALVLWEQNETTNFENEITLSSQHFPMTSTRVSGVNLYGCKNLWVLISWA